VNRPSVENDRYTWIPVRRPFVSFFFFSITFKFSSLYGIQYFLPSPAKNLALLLFAIKMATLPFWAEIKNLRTRHREAYKFVNSGRNDMILSDLERYDVGLPEYVKFITNIYGFRSKEF
jgi:hypothetical protein